MRPSDRFRHPTFDAGPPECHPSDICRSAMDENELRGMRVALALLLAGIVAGGAVDLVLDAPANWLSAHVVYEVILIAGALGASVWLWRGWRRAAESAAALRRSLAERQRERDVWRARAHQALDGLGHAVEDQFLAWGLTPTEREVALLLVQGHGHKQIAAATGRSERTVRQHAVATYRKAGLGGRAELAAFFLADLRLPSAHPDG
jgi:DNA-binding CsgD family transcriptional regulator